MKNLAIFFIIAAVILRVLRHFGYIDLPPNFAPVTAIALFSGTYLNRKYAYVIPIIAMLIADYFIGYYNPFIMASVYGSFLLAAVIGLYIKNNKDLTNIIGGALLSSILFYLITNYAVWIFSGIYPQTFSGLLDSYIMAIPFFRSTLLGDIFYVTVLFGGYEFVNYLIKNRLFRQRRTPVENL